MTRVYLVRRTALASARWAGAPGFHPSGGEEGMSMVPVRAFATRAAAERHCAELEAEAQTIAAPPLFCVYQFPCPPAQFRAGLGLLGLTPPTFSSGRRSSYFLDGEGDVNRFREWWAATAPTLTAAQRAGVWDLFGDFAFYSVAEIELEG